MLSQHECCRLSFYWAVSVPECDWGLDDVYWGTPPPKYTITSVFGSVNCVKQFGGGFVFEFYVDEVKFELV